jgi:integrase
MSQKKQPKKEPLKSGIYKEYSDIISETLAFCKRKADECPKGVTFHLTKIESGKSYTYRLKLQFINPTTEKRSSKSCGINSFNDESVIEALQKAHKVANALKSFTKASEFWEWYDKEILGKNEIKNDLITYHQIFQEIENRYFRGTNRNTERNRVKNVEQLGGCSDLKTFNCQYGAIFKKFPDWDKYPTWDEIKSVWFSMGTKTTGTDSGQGTKSFKDAKTAIKAICELCPNSDELLKKVNKIDVTQTIFSKRQSIALDDFLKWYHQAYDEIPSIKRDDWKLARESWLWVASMCVLYGLRPSEIASAQNLTKPVTIDGETVYALTDKKRNPEAIIVLGEFTYFGASVKTGHRAILPIPLSYLWDELNIRKPLLPIYNPCKDSKPETIAGGFDHQFSNRMESYNCPVTQKYAFRHLFNQLCEMCGIPVAIRSRLMGHSESANTGKYKKRRNLKTELAIITSANSHPMPYEIAISELQRLGFDVNLPEIKAILKVIYRLKD